MAVADLFPDVRTRGRYLRHWYKKAWGKWRVYVDFVVTNGKHSGEILTFHASVEKRSKGYRAVGRFSSLGVCLHSAVGDWKASPASLAKVDTVTLILRTVTRDHKRRPLPAAERYIKVHGFRRKEVQP